MDQIPANMISYRYIYNQYIYCDNVLLLIDPVPATVVFYS